MPTSKGGARAPRDRHAEVRRKASFCSPSVDSCCCKQEYLQHLRWQWCLYLGTTIRTVPSPLQNRQRSPSMSFPEPEHSRHLATIWNSALVVSGNLPGISLTTSAR